MTAHAPSLLTCSFLERQEWLDAIVSDDKYWDQNAFNDLMRRGAVFEPRRGDRLFLCATATLHPAASA